jgi:hypothetical protein
MWQGAGQVSDDDQVSDNDSATGPDQVPYENTADARWARKAMDLLRSRRLQVAAFDTEGVASAQVWGTCPRCGHDIDVQRTLTVPVPQVRGLWTALTGRATPLRQGISDTVEVGCGCTHPHPAAPPNVLGCGVSFRLPITPPPTRSPPSTPATPSAPGTPAADAAATDAAAVDTAATSPSAHTEPSGQQGPR